MNPWRWCRPVLSFLLITSAYGSDDSRRIPLPEGVFYYRPAATTYGLESAWNNPAGLGRTGMTGFEIMADYYAGDYFKSWGTVFYRDGAATAVRHVDNPAGEDYDEWLASLGLKLGQTLNVGTSYRYFRKGPGIYNNRHLWNLGFATQGMGSFAVGAVFSNLNRGRVDGERTATEQRYSLGYRPLGQVLTVAADVFLSSRQNLSEAEFVYHAELIPTPGLYVNSWVDSDGNFQIGLRANLLKYFVGSHSRFDKAGHNGRTTMFVGATNMRQASLIPENPRRLDLTISGTVAENPPQPIFGPRSVPFLSLITDIYRAADDRSIGAMKLNLDRLALGMGQAQELRDALQNFRSRGKRIICHLGAPNNLGYYVASAADSILIPPVSQLQLVGLRAELTFWAGTLEKVGARIELLRVGEYKSAPEAYTRESSSDENREQINALLDDLFEQFVAAIADGRGLSADSVRHMIDRGPFTSDEALRYGLVDGLCYRDLVARNYFAGLPSISFRRYQSDTLVNDSWQPTPVIAVVVADGEITQDSGNDGWPEPSSSVRPRPMAQAFERAWRNPEVAGIVLRVNSPGGWALAGEEIHRAAAKAAETKPLMVSMANVAASGGYYIATPSRRLFVNPATVTGSIGIYGGKLDLSGLYEKIKLGKELYTRGQYAGMLSTMRPFLPEEREKYQSHLQAFYDHFVSLVSTSRRLTEDSVDQLARGRVWTGRQAVACGLADQTGGIKPALDHLAAEIGLERYRVEIYPQKRPLFLLPGASLWKQVMAMLSGKGNSPEGELPLLPVSTEGAILARMPFDLSIE
ncbi:MAG: signal peptide peptidase SppA [Candidatus Zixiibacteriota bacterium]